MLLCRHLRCWKPQSSHLHTRLFFNSTRTAQATEAFQWKPFIQEEPIVEKWNRGPYDGAWIAMQKKRKLENERHRKRQKPVIPSDHHKEGSNEEILALEVQELLAEVSLDAANDQGDSARPNGSVEDGDAKPTTEQIAVELYTEQEVNIVSLSSTGDGLAYSPNRDHVYVVPFTAPGDTVIARPFKQVGSYVHADFIKVIKPSAQREGITPKCQYFAECSGCQLQMISYEDQLKHKKTIVEKAFKHFSGLSAQKIPAVEDTMGSPLQYGYRTKLTPHFSVPKSVSKRNSPLTKAPPIGFNRKGKLQDGQSSVMDIEHCPIGTPILQEGLKIERARVQSQIQTYKNGATILLRESTERAPIPVAGSALQNGLPPVTLDFDSAPISQELVEGPNEKAQYKVSFPTHTELKTYTSIESSMTTEYIGPYKFINKAGSFFQNNNSILRPFTSYVYDNCIPKSQSTSTIPKPETRSELDSISITNSPSIPDKTESGIKYLLDAYCGSGLFTITLSPLFSSALGIDIDRRGIEAARVNAENNDIANAGFIEADAKDLFADVPFPPDQSLVVIDPPRKGASADFLRQLCQFGAKRVIYVSCNVHTQARDVGMIVNGFKEGCRYEIESLRGFDFFPQTGHVEGVCVLNRVD